MTEEKRTPAFWILKNCGDVLGVRGWAHESHYDLHYRYLSENDAKEKAASHTNPNMKIAVVPVYHRVVKKPKAHGVGWAVARLKEGKRVRRRGWQRGSYTDANHIDGGQSVSPESLLATDWELAE